MPQIAFTAHFLRRVEKVKIYTYILIQLKAIKISLYPSRLAECCPHSAVKNGFYFLLHYNPNTFRILSGTSHPIARHTIYEKQRHSNSVLLFPDKFLANVVSKFPSFCNTSVSLI